MRHELNEGKESLSFNTHERLSVSWFRPQDKLGALPPEHRKRGHGLDVETNADVGDFDLLRPGRCDLVRDDSMPVGERVGHQIVVGHQEKRADGGWLVALTRRPGAD